MTLWDDERPRLGIDFDPEPWEVTPTECPRCGGTLTIDLADPSVGIFGDAIFCENDRLDGLPCGWGEGDEL
jgi:hypothetical protein